jgi:hypothetical protein
LELNIRIKTFFQLEFLNKLVDLENSNLNKIDNIIIKFPTAEKLLERVIRIFLQFNSEYWITPVEYMPVYGIMQELDNYINSKRNRCPLTHIEKEWIFDHRQAWEHEKKITAMEGRPPIKFIAK